MLRQALVRKPWVWCLVTSILGIHLHLLSNSTPAFNLGYPTRTRQAATPTITLERVIGGLSSPLLATHARDTSGRLFLVEQPGRIRIFQNGTLLETPFLDISSQLIFSGERGLLGLAFHPEFATNRRFFVNYTRRPDGATVIAEYQASASNPNLASNAERILLTIPQPFANHNGGMIEFGPDGFLYIGMGDGGSAGDPQNNAQNVDSLLGKFLRINVDSGNPYSSPSDNPFFGSTRGRDEIYAVGLRNPFRFSFDRKTGELYAGDVGQNRLEEIDIITRGGNYGWRVMEASDCFNPSTNCNRTGLTLPIAEYDHSVGCSVTGGYVYRGSRFPSLDGIYFYGDYCSGVIFGYRNGRSFEVRAPDSNLNITSFGEDSNGELYVISQGGEVFRILGPQNEPCSLTCPNDITVTDEDGNGSEVVTFSAPQTSGNCGTVTSTPASGSTFAVGTTTVRSRTADGSAECSFSITVRPKPADSVEPAVQVIAPNGGETITAGDQVTITWTSSDNVAVVSQDIDYLFEFIDLAPVPIVTGLPGNAQSFLWEFNGRESASETIRIRVIAFDEAENRGTDMSDAPLTLVTPTVDTTPPTVRVVFPNGGEKLKAGTTTTIRWESADNQGINRHDVLLSTDGGASFPTTLASGLPGTAQTFDFVIPTTQGKSKTARIQVRATDDAGNSAFDTSDTSFRIKKRK